jgi:hypothetical protein
MGVGGAHGPVWADHARPLAEEEVGVSTWEAAGQAGEGLGQTQVTTVGVGLVGVEVV